MMGYRVVKAVITRGVGVWLISGVAVLITALLLMPGDLVPTSAHADQLRTGTGTHRRGLSVLMHLRASHRHVWGTNWDLVTVRVELDRGAPGGIPFTLQIDNRSLTPSAGFNESEANSHWDSSTTYESLTQNWVPSHRHHRVCAAQSSPSGVVSECANA